MLKGFREIVKMYDSFIFDLWGVLYEGGPIFEDALDVLIRLNSLNKTVVLISNSPYSNRGCANNLQRYGLKKELYKSVFTAGDLCKDYIKRSYKSPQNFYVIDSYYWDTWENINTYHKISENIEEADAILCLAIPKNIKTLENIQSQYDHVFSKAIACNLPFLCANPDIFAPSSKKLQIRPGLMSMHYQQLGGRVLNFGKPFSKIFTESLKLLGNPKRVLMTGDTGYTDINGALNQKIDSLLITKSYGDSQIFTSKANYFSPILKW